MAVPSVAAVTPAVPPSAANIVSAVLSGLLGLVGLTPGKGPVPAAPLTFGLVLTFAERELQYTLFNRPPAANPSQTSEDGTGVITGDLNATDVTGAALTYTVTSEPTHGSVTINPDGTYTYTPSTVAFVHNGGTDSFTVAINDGTSEQLPGGLGGIQTVLHSLAQAIGISGPDTTTVTVPVTEIAINHPPTLTLAAGTPDAATGAVTITAVTVDPDGDPLTVSVATPANGAVSTPTLTDAATGTYTFTYTPTATARHAASAEDATTAQTTDTVTVSVDDGHGATTVGGVAVSIAPQNAVPKETSDPTEFFLSEPVDKGTLFGTFNVSDADNDTLTYSVTTGPAKGTVVINGGTFTYTPTPSARLTAAASGAKQADKTDSFTVEVDDGHGGQITFPVSVTVDPAPTATGLATPIGEAISSDGKLLYVTQAGKGSVAVVDLNPQSNTYLTVIKTIPTNNTLPYSAVLSPDGKSLYVTNFEGGVTIIDTDSSSANYLTAVDNVPAGTDPYFEAISPDGNRLYVTDAVGGVSIIDTQTGTANYGKIIATTATVDGARGIVISPTTSTPFVVAANKFYVLDSDSGTGPVGEVEQTTTIAGASNMWGMALTPDGERAYVGGFGSNTVSVIDTNQQDGTYGTALATITVSGKPTTVALSPDGTRAYVDTESGGVAIIDTDPSSATYNTVLETVNVPTGEGDVIVSPDGNEAYVTDLGGGAITVLPLPLA